MYLSLFYTLTMLVYADDIHSQSYTALTKWRLGTLWDSWGIVIQASPILGAYFYIAHTIGTQFFVELKSKYVLKATDFFLRPRKIEVMKFRNSNESLLKRLRPSCLRIVNGTNGKEKIESKHKLYPHNKQFFLPASKIISTVRAASFMSNREEEGRKKREVACLWWGSLPLPGVRGCWQEKNGCRLSLPWDSFTLHFSKYWQQVTQTWAIVGTGAGKFCSLCSTSLPWLSDKPPGR